MKLTDIREQLAEIAQGTSYEERKTRLKLEKLIKEIEVEIIDEMINAKPMPIVGRTVLPVFMPTQI